MYSMDGLPGYGHDLNFDPICQCLNEIVLFSKGPRGPPGYKGEKVYLVNTIFNLYMHFV